MDIGKYHLQLCQRYALVTTSCANLPECINDHINLLICELRLQMAWKFHHVPNDGSTKPHLICENLSSQTSLWFLKSFGSQTSFWFLKSFRNNHLNSWIALLRLMLAHSTWKNNELSTRRNNFFFSSFACYFILLSLLVPLVKLDRKLILFINLKVLKTPAFLRFCYLLLMVQVFFLRSV